MYLKFFFIKSELLKTYQKEVPAIEVNVKGSSIMKNIELFETQNREKKIESLEDP